MIKIFFLPLLLTTSLFAQHQSGTLTIHIKNFHHAEGMAVATLFREEDEMPKKPFKRETGAITNDTATILFTDIPYGKYAIILFHDENSNGIVDHTVFLPAEPIGFSNNWQLGLFSGMPNFKKLQFTFSEIKNEFSIPVND